MTPSTPQVVDNRLYGRGSADMKGGIAAAICALSTLEAAGHEPGCDIVFQFVADEERGGGARYPRSDGVGAPARGCVYRPRADLSRRFGGRKGPDPGGDRGQRPPGPRQPAAGRRLGCRARRPDRARPPRRGLWRPGTPLAWYADLEHRDVPRWERREHRGRAGRASGSIAGSCPGTSLDESLAGLRRRVKAAGLEAVDYEIEVFDYGEGSEMSPEHPFAELVRQSVASVTGTRPDDDRDDLYHGCQVCP